MNGMKCSEQNRAKLSSISMKAFYNTPAGEEFRKKLSEPRVDHTSTRCVKCGSDSTYTRRKKENKDNFLVPNWHHAPGSNGLYRCSRCYKHWRWRNKNKKAAADNVSQ